MKSQESTRPNGINMIVINGKTIKGLREGNFGRCGSYPSGNPGARENRPRWIGIV